MPRLLAAALATAVAVVAVASVYRWVRHVDELVTGPEIRAPSREERTELAQQGRLGFARLTRGAGWGIYVAAGDGSRPRRLVSGRAPAWSPDGRYLAFERSGEIWVARADGTSPRRVANFGSNPAWSPDGARIAFDQGRLVGIFVVGADGRGMRRLTSDGEHPAWSPDGRRIAFVSDRDGVMEGDDAFIWNSPIAQLFVMNADGSGQRRLSRTETHDSSPAWSPDGGRIAFSTRSPEWLTTDEGLVVVNPEGGDVRRRFVEAFDTEPAWSPDGTWIAVVCEEGGTWLCAARADGRGPLLRLARLGGGLGAWPSWWRQ